MTLSKTDAKYFGLVEPFVADIQVFVDKNIQGSSTLTAAAIHKGFTAENDSCDLHSEEFIKGFRLAVRENKITGIESAKRLGYRRVGAYTTPGKSAADLTLESIEPYLEDIQVFVNTHIKGDVRMTAAVIYEKFSAEHECKLTSDEFVKAFRLALREGKITGLESAYRFGYKERTSAASSSDKSETKPSKTGHEVCEVIVDDRRRVVALDRFNWGYQVRKDSGKWATEAYFSDVFKSIRCLARKLIDDEIKGMDDFNVDELEDKFIAAETRLAKLLKENMVR